MNYKHGDSITIDNISYVISWTFGNHYEILLNKKYGLMSKQNYRIVAEPIYNRIISFNSYFYLVEINSKQGLMDKTTCKITIETIYDGIHENYDHYSVGLNEKFGLIDKKTLKVVLNPGYNTGYYTELVEIYNELIKSKMRVEKLKQLEEKLIEKNI
jgi:hypothetical protein